MKLKLLRIAISPVVFALAVILAIAGALSIVGTLFLYLSLLLLICGLVQRLLHKIGVDVGDVPGNEEIKALALAASMPVWWPFSITARFIHGGKA